MSIKRYDSVKFIGGMFVIAEKEDGKFVKYEDYAESERYGRQADITIENLERKVEQLAAENAALKAAIEAHKHGFVRCNCCGDELMCHTDDVCRALDETPATDAILAEVRASGVEMFAEHLSGMNISASETSVREFAAQLRQEAK